MWRSPLFPLFALTVCVMGASHIVSLELALYWRYEWLDIPMHLLGGTAVTLALFVLYERQFIVADRHIQFFPVLFFAMIVGLSWEVFEIWAGIPLLEDDFEADLVLDLLMDLSGGALGWFIGERLLRA